MSAVISGNGLGLFSTSLNQLGTSFGSAGRARNDEHYVNVSTGNLVLRSQDEQLLFRGMSIAQLRTYNSQGTLAQVGADAWLTGFERRVELLSGTLNAAGSVIRRHTGDGSYQDFTYASANTYVSTAGDGAHDVLVWNGTARTWAYTEGSTRREEGYADHADATLRGRLTRLRDLRSDGTAPVTWDVVYNASNAIAEIRSSDGEALVYGYDANGRLDAVSTRENGVLVGQVRYEYDAAGRLSSVLVDLTPQDGAGDRETWDATAAANNDGYLFRTTYTYVDASSLRISTVRRSDGTVSSFTYDANGRVRTATQGDTNTNDADGAGQTVTYTYGTGSTDVSDSTGRTWTYAYDAAGQLTQVQAPAIAGQRDVTSYAYDASGNIARIATTRGAQLLAQSDFSYDANGNVLWQWELVDPGVNASARAVQRTYTATNQVASETFYTGLDADGAAAAQAPTGGQTTRYLYDAQNRLRFVVNAAGDVQELEYATSGNGIGQVSNAREYLGAGYSGTYTLAALTAWATPAQKANSTLVESTYDLKGRLAQTRAFANVDAAGAGIDNDAASITQYVYDAQGLLRQSIVLRSSTATPNDGRDTKQTTTYAYDGMGRLLSETLTEQVGAGAVTTLRSSSIAYVDSGNTLRATVETGTVGDGNAANDLLRVEARNAAGQVVAITESAVSGGTARTTQNHYDSAGRLRAVQDAGGGRTYFFYDAKGDLVGQVDPTGALTESVRDSLGRVVETRAYGVRLDTTGWLVAGNVIPQTLDAVRPGWSTDFTSLPATMNTAHVNNATYPNAITHQNGRLAFRVSPNATNASPSIYVNDMQRLEENIGYRAEVTTDAAMTDTYLLFAIETSGATRRAAAYFRNGTLYKNVTGATGGNVSTAIGTLAANTTYVVEAQTRDGGIDYWVYVKGQDRSSGFAFTVDAQSADWGPVRLRLYAYMTPNVSGNALYVDNLSQTDAALRTTQQTYDGNGLMLTQTDAEGAVTTHTYDGAGRLLQSRTTDAAGTAATARVHRYFYDAAGREVAQLDAEGYLTEAQYDRAGRLVRSIAYANPTPAGARANGALADLRPAGHADDQIARVFYDGRSQVIAELDAEGYLTEYVYDDARNQRAVRRYGTQLTGLTGTESLATLLTGVQSGTVRESRRSFDARGLLTIEVDPQGTVTRYAYDAAGRLIRSEAAHATSDQRDGLRRYDVFGNVVAELGGEGAAKLTSNMTAAQIDAIYAQYGVRHSYDALDRRIESIDAHGNRTWYFHDAIGRVTHVVRGMQNADGVRNVEGEVVETRYDAFGQVRDSIAYTGRIAIASPFGREQVAASVQALRYAAASDTRTRFDYDRRGLLLQQTDALGHRTSLAYNAFGELVRQTRQIDATRSLVSTFGYDLRGQRTDGIDDVGGAALAQQWRYDAFGRLIASVDARGTTTTVTYDRLGRQVAQQRIVSGRQEQVRLTYDAWSRTIGQTDAMGRTTTFEYSDTARTIVVTTPEGVTSTTKQNRHGETESVRDAKGNGTWSIYDKDGNVVDAGGGAAGTSHQVYDARGLLTETTDATDRKVRFEYDAAGRVTARIEDPAGLALKTRYVYDGQGRQVSVIDPTGSRTAMVYDAKGQLTDVVQDADGLALKTTYAWDARGLQLSVTEGAGSTAAITTAYAYDALGRRISETVAPGTLNLITRYAYDANGNVVTRTDATNRVTRYTYDEADRLVFTVDGEGGVTRQWYDANGRLVATRRYAAAISLASLPTETTTAAVAARIVANDDADVQAYTVYDRDGRVRLTVDGAGAVALTAYDTLGRVVRVTRFADTAELIGPVRAKLMSGNAVDSDVLSGGIAPDETRDHDSFVVYDAVGRVRFTVAADGAVAETRYDPAGRVGQNWIYQGRIALGASERIALEMGLISESSMASRVSSMASTADVRIAIHDGAGRERYSLQRISTLNAQNVPELRYAVVERRYDDTGRVVAQTQYGITLATSTPLGEAAIATALQAGLSTNPAVRSTQIRTSAFVYDAAGRLRFSIDASGSVTESRYDETGRIVEARAYENRPDATTASTLATLDAWGRAQLSTALRASRFVYDKAGRQRFTLDASGSMNEARYDAAGRMIEARAYGVRPAASLLTEAQLDTWGRAQQAADVRRTQTVYDLAGRAKEVVDADGKSDRYGYDGAGLLVQYTNRNGDVWTYAYDAAGRRTSELSPTVTVGVVGADGVVTQTSRRILTRTDYDGLGQIVKRIENGDADDERAIEYRYDNRGNLVRTILPDPGKLEVGSDVLVNAGQATIDVVYDAWGRAVVRKDPRGYYSYTIYDAQGRVAFEVDQRRFVTAYTYDAYGDRVSLRRYATALQGTFTAGQPLTLAQMRAPGALVASADDRTLTHAYDALGRVTSVAQSAIDYYDGTGTLRRGSPTTTFAYDAYGQLTTESVLLDVDAQGVQRWGVTTRRYDVLGRVVLTIDAEGYATSTKYNVTGEVSEIIEHARALTDAQRAAGVLPASGDANTGFDRVTRWQYDALGRRTVETSVRSYRRADGGAGTRNVDTVYGYDGEGRVTTTTVDAGTATAATTTTRYDALGRVVSMREPERAVLAAQAGTLLQTSSSNDLTTGSLYVQASPYTSIVYDAFGNAVMTRRHADGWTAGSATPPAADDARDAIEITRYDYQGRAITTRSVTSGAGASAKWTVIRSSYDAADNLVKTWYTLTGGDAAPSVLITGTYGYDETGRQTSSRQARGAAVDVEETVDYNAFGEVTGKRYAGLSGELTYRYDAAGRLVGTNEGGAARVLGYNLAGHQVRDVRKLDATTDAVTSIVTDRLGRAVRTTLPPHFAWSAVRAVVEQQFDRWGNVVQVIDARGFQTNYRYNDFNQVVRDERPLVEVVFEDGTRSWIRPVNEWYYDAFGRLVATKDANGNVRANEYDAAGRLLASKDAYGNATRYAYDALGNQRLTQDPLGYLSYRTFDRQGRVVEIGDYLPDENGAQRERQHLQQYVLDENGDRIVVTDALGYSARYDYDARSQLLRSRSATGLVMTYAYNALGLRTSERYARVTDESRPSEWIGDQNYIGDPYYGYWSEEYVDDGTRVDREGETVNVDHNTWDYDAFGRLVDHNNLSARDHDYVYDAHTGLLRSETAAGGHASGAASKTITYHPNGKVHEVTEAGGTPYFRYEYDAAGNRTLEESRTRDGSGAIVHTVTRTLYDSHNRVQRVTQDDLSSGKRVFDLTYSYDAVGNRRSVRAVSGYGPSVQPVPIADTPPVVIQPVADRTVRTSIDSTFSVLVGDVFRDAENDPLSLSFAQANGTALPPWLTVQHDAATGRLVFTAKPGAIADTDVTVRLTATQTTNFASASTDFVVRVRANTGPQIVGASTETVRIKTGAPWSMELPADVWFRDADVGDVLQLTIANAAGNPVPWATLDASNPSVVRVSGMPVAGTYTLQVRATDARGASVIKTFRFVAAANSAPTVVAAQAPVDAVMNRQFGWSVPLSQVFADADGDALTVTATGLPSWMSFQYVPEQEPPTLTLGGRVPADAPADQPYVITFTATDSAGARTTTTLTVTTRANRAPVLVTAGTLALPPMRVGDLLDHVVRIDSLFSDPDGDAIHVESRLVEGSSLAQWLTVTVDRDAGTIRFQGRPGSNSYAGTPTFRLRAFDADGLAVEKTVGLTIGTDNAPLRNPAVALSDQTVSIGRSFSFALPAGIYTDADAGDVLTLTPRLVIQRVTADPITGIVFRWIEDQPLPAWLSYDAATRTFSGTVPSHLASSTLNIRVRAFDGRQFSTHDEAYVGASGVTTDGDFALRLVPFVNTVPRYTAGSLPNRSGVEGQPLSFALPAGAFTDPDGDALTYSATVLNQAGIWVTAQSIGLTINASTGQLTGTPGSLLLNSYQVRIHAHDPQGASVYGQFALTVARKPVAPAPASRTVALNVPFSHTVTGFSDPEGGALTYSAKLGSGAALPSWLGFSSTGVLSGTPTVAGTYSIVVTATDPSGLASTTTLTLTAANTPPQYNAGQLADRLATAGAAFGYTVPAGAFTDPNGDVLTYSADANGAALPSWLTFNPATRTFSGTPRASGSWTIRVLATDPSAVSAAGTFVLTVPNAAPTNPVALPSRSGNLGQPVTWTLPAGAFADANHDPLTYTLMVERPGYWAEGPRLPIEEPYIREPGEPEEPVYRWVPPQWVAAPLAGLAIDAATGRITGTPSLLASFSEYRAKIVASDPSGAQVEAIFDIAINRVPSAPYVPALSARHNAAFAYALPAFADADYDAVNHSLTGLPPGLSFDPWSLSISGTPTAVGSYTLTYAADDGRGGIASTTFTLHVAANTAPTAVTLNNQSAAAGMAWSWIVPAFHDADGDALSYSAAGMPAGIGFDPATRTFSGAAAIGTYTISVTASDGRGGQVTSSFVLTVLSNRAPVVEQPLEDQFLEPYQSLDYTFPASTFSDPDGHPLTYTATLSTGAALPTWLRFNAANRLFFGVPTGSLPKTWLIRVTATDPAGASVSTVFSIGYAGSDGIRPLDQVPEGDDGLSVSYVEETDTSLLIVEPPDTGGGGSGGGGTSWTVPYQVTEYWFTYDAENRIKVNNGKLVDGQIVVDAGDDSYALTYDAAGRAVARYTRSIQGGTTIDQVHRTAYDLRGNKTMEFHAERLGAAPHQTGGIAKRFEYNDAGQLKQTLSYFKNGETRLLLTGTQRLPTDGSEPQEIHIGGWLRAGEDFTYDFDGRLLTQTSKERDLGARYVSDWQIAPGTNQYTDTSLLHQKSKTDYRTAAGRGYDAAGRLIGYQYTLPGGVVHTYTSSFAGWDSYQETYVLGTSSNANYRTTTNTLTYDVMGRLVQQREHTNYKEPIDDRIRYYAYDGEGRVQLRRSGTWTNGVFRQTPAANGTRDNVLFVHAAGQQQAELKEGGQTRLSNGRTQDVQQLQSLGGVGNYAAGGGKITVTGGETLQSLAQRVYGNSQLWYVLAQANGLGDPNAELVEGTSLNAPSVTVSSNDANTFKPYNGSEAIGGTTPSLPYITPPPKQSCNVLATVLIAVVVAVASVYTAGAAAGLLGIAGGSTAAVGSSVMAGGLTGLTATAGSVASLSMTAAVATSAFVGGAVGNLAGQVAGNLLRVREGFDLREAFAGGLTSAAGAGIGRALGAANLSGLRFAQQPVRTAASSVFNGLSSYAANRIAGLDAKFEWRSIAAGAVASVASSYLAPAVTGAFHFNDARIGGQFGRDLAGGFTGGLASSLSRRMFGFDERVNFGTIFADAFGSAAGNYLVGDHMRQARAMRPREIPSFAAGHLDKIERVHGGAGRAAAEALYRNFDASVDPTLAHRTVNEYMTLATNADSTEDARADLMRRYYRMTEGGETLSDQQLDEVVSYSSFVHRGKPHVELGELKVVRAPPGTFLTSAKEKAAANAGPPAFGASWIDAGLIGLGRGVQRIGAEIERRPWLRYALIGIEIASGPLLFAARTAVRHSFVGEAMESLERTVLDRSAERFVRAGQDSRSAVLGGIGVLTVVSLAISGVAGLAKRLPAVQRRITGLQARMGRLMQTLGRVDPPNAPRISRGTAHPPPAPSASVAPRSRTTQLRSVTNDAAEAPVPAPPRPQLLLGPGNPTTHTLEQIRRMPADQRWRAGEQYAEELYGSTGQQHFPVPSTMVDGEMILKTGGRNVDVPIPTANGGVLAIEVKTYGMWRTVDGAPQAQTVPLGKEGGSIRQQILKDVWLRSNVEGYDPRWVFVAAPPSPELAQYLRAKRIPFIVHE